MTRGDIVASVKIKLSYGDKNYFCKIEELAKENEKQPLQYQVPEVSLRPVGNYAGKLIQDANQGLTVGGAKVSTLHGLYY